jgi:hypothetical protein
MLWQKARFTGSALNKSIIGREVWLVSKPPHIPQILTQVNFSTGDHNKDKTWKGTKAFKSNLFDNDGAQLLVIADRVELLAEFSEDVEPVSISKWFAQETIQ